MNARQLFDHWDDVRRGLMLGLERFTEVDLTFRPAQVYERTVGDIALHIAEAEAGWFHFAMRGEYAVWPMFTRQEYPTWDDIIGLLKAVHDKTLAWLESLDEDDLDLTFTAPWGDEYSYRAIIWHVLEHEIHHRGELYLCLGLLGREAPEI
jgi:uncharacterized damage-inducible protein DinB